MTAQHRRRWRHGLARLATAALFPLLAAPAAASAQRNGEPVEVASVRFPGADQIPAALLATAIETVPTRCVSAALQPLCLFGLSKDRYFLDQRALAADVFRLRVFYYQRGFRQARVELDTVRGDAGMHVRFRIAEGRPVRVRSITVEGAEGVGRDITRNLPTRRGEPFSMVDFEATRDSLVGRLANLGYAAADALANYDIPDGGYDADVSFFMIPGPVTRFGRIEIVGADRVSPDVVERMLTFREGDLFSRQALLRSQRNVYGLEVFRHAEIVTPQRLDPTDSILPVRVQVNEGDLHRVRLGVGMSTSDYLNAEGRWTSRNFLGGGRRLELRGRVTNIVADPLRYIKPPFESCTGIYCDVAGSVAVDFAQPFFFGPQNTLATGLFLERFSLAGVYVRTTRGAYGSLTRSFGRAAASMGYRPELTRLESDGDLIFCVNFVACEARDIDVLREPHRLAPLAFGFSVDRSNSIFSPTRGFIVRLDSEFAATPTGSEYAYARLLGDVSGYHEPFRGIVVAGRIRPGYARSLGEPGTGLGLHPQKRFFAGGPNSVRGYAQYRLGPKLLTADAVGVLAQPVDGARPGAGCTAQSINDGSCDVSALAAAHPNVLDVRPVGGALMLEGNLELRYPIWGDRLRGATFLDFGQVWRDAGDVSASGLQFTPGLGIRYFSPVGPIRIDVGYNAGGAERLTVITTEVCDARQTPCGEIRSDVSYAPGDLANERRLRTLTPVQWQPHSSFTSRLQLHFSIGQAF